MQVRTVEQYSEQAAREFIQTAVFVDDEIFEQPKARDSRKPSDVTVPRRRPRSAGTAGSAGKTARATELLQDTSEDRGYGIAFDPRAVVSGFAKRRILCSLFQPRRGASYGPQSDVFPLCAAADVVILDWNLEGDRGGRAAELICELVSQAVSDVPEQLRLILVYTGAPDLPEIQASLYRDVSAAIEERFSEERFSVERDEENLAFHTENSRVRIIGKRGTRAGEPASAVGEAELADVAISEFAKLAAGLLHATALLGLSEIRKNSRKILSRFHQSLDPGFLTHRALSLPNEDASTHVIPLLASEIEAVLEDTLEDPVIPRAVIEDWCDNVWNPGSHVKTFIGAGVGDDERRARLQRERVKLLCTEGFGAAVAAATAAGEQGFPNPKSRNDATRKVRNAGSILLDSEDDDANHRFAHLMSSRVVYGERTRRTLKLGCVVQVRGKGSDNGQYLLCVQPLCDCVRLAESRAFAFLRMSVSDDGKAFHVAVTPNGRIELTFRPKAYNCYIAPFTPDRTAKEVVSRSDESDALFFQGQDRKKYYWIDQLKPSHAQRAVERFATDLARVGLTESDWLRRLGEA